jgi:hypothetical protein
MTKMRGETIQRILYHLDDSLHLYGYGGEYRKIRETCRQMAEAGAPVHEWYNICLALGLPVSQCIRHDTIVE